MVRLSGTWTQLPRLLYKSALGITALHHQKLVEETLENELQPAEAALMAVYREKAEPDIRRALYALLAHRMLAGGSAAFSQAGFLMRDNDSNEYRHCSLQTARELKDAAGAGWEQQVQRAEEILSRLQYVSGGVSRFFNGLDAPFELFSRLLASL